MALSDFLPVVEALRAHGVGTATAALATLENLIGRGQAIGAAATAFDAGTATTIAVPYSAVLALAQDLDTFVLTYGGSLDYPYDLFTACRVAQRALFDLRVVRATFAEAHRATAGGDDPAVSPDGSRVPWVLHQGDTLERLALRFLGDVTRWPDIAELNGLTYPFLETRRGLVGAPPTADRSGVPDGVRVTGEVVWLPPDAHVPAGQTLVTDADVTLYGRDWALVDGMFDLNADGEPATIAGVPNMTQALGQRIGTGRGELLLHPDYGIEHTLAVGVEGTRANTIGSALALARAVAEDPRVIRVAHLELLFRDTVNHVALSAVLIGPGQPEVPLNQVLPS